MAEPKKATNMRTESAESKGENVSLQKAIPELEREVMRIAELESDPMLRAILAGRIILSVEEIADSIEKNFIEGKVTYANSGALDPVQSSIAAKELPRFLDFIRRSLEKTKTLYLEQHNVEGCPASFDLGYWSAVARKVGSVSNWDYWASQKNLTPRETACLKFELDPKHFDEIHSNRNTHLQAGALADRVVEVERSATRDTEGENLSPAKWIQWAQSKGYAVPEQLVKAVAEVERKAQEVAQASDEKNYYEMYGADPSAEIYPVWQKRLNEIAEEMKKESPLKRYPTKGKAARKLAIELVVPGGMSKEELAKKTGEMTANVERRTRKSWDK